jgi:hypothetical protein
LAKYFKAMQWLQLAVYCLNNKQQVKDAIGIAVLLNSIKTSKGESLMSLYNAIYEPTVFLIGEADNVSIKDIAEYLEKENIEKELVYEQSTLEKINTYLVEIATKRNRIRSKIEMSCSDKINFMPARYLVDNEIIQELVDVKIDASRAFPKGLDMFAAFGSKSALNILLNIYKEDEQWNEYLPTMKKLQQKFKNYNEWDVSVYNKWIESLIALQRPNKSYPAFMQTPSWEKKNLNTSLASWTDLKHDAILYGEQPMDGAECGGGGDEPPEPITVGYVEPNILFWKKLDELIHLTENILIKNDIMTPDLKSVTKRLQDYVEFLSIVSEKELRKEKLSDNEYNTIEYFGASLEYYTLSVLDPELHLSDWSLVEGADKSVAVVADIYTRGILGCNKNGILHEAVGNVNSIYVVVEIEGNLYLTKGAVYSYYEFVLPFGNRLTDEEWQKMLNNNKNAPVPVWMDGLLLNISAPKSNERLFYSSGC